ncbi:MAG TPA: hypothetical protein VF158_16015 [Longimicrobiales bacterium]
MLSTIFALITLAVAVLLACYVRWVPEGPSCPRCGAVTEAGAPASGVAAWLDRWAAVRACAACGWSGRQRSGGARRVVDPAERAGGRR